MTVMLTIINNNHDNVGDDYDVMVTIINNHDNVDHYYCDDDNNK